MSSKKKILIQTLSGQQRTRAPFWFMRQAGRYLPEYRKLRKKTGSFLDLCYTPELAAEVTIQPIRRFGMDGAILFSDILVIPHALGLDLHFEEGRGPILSAISAQKDLDKLTADGLEEKLSPVYEALRLTIQALPPETSMIGFAGAPWTLACYMIEGGSSKDFSKTKKIAATDKNFFKNLITLLTKSVTRHIIAQIEAGAETIQLFDSWAGILDEQSYQDYVVAPAKDIVEKVKEKFPAIPLIGFPRQSGERFLAYAEATQIDALNFDDSISLDWARENLSAKIVLQGCLHPNILAGDRTTLLQEAKKILEHFEDKAFVFNLGHGILPHTPIDNVKALCDFLKNHENRHYTA